MSSNKIIVQEYLSSLKEDKELDYLFPILLNVMGFRIVQTAKESKGQPQYGKDIVAIGKDDYGNKFKWYFELKGYKDCDITDRNYSSIDGIRESIIEAKDAYFNDSSIAEFNKMPVKIVLVHNGIIKPNIRPTFEGFISKEFGPDEFERWDIYYLTELFSKYLFGEYLLADEESNRLFKRTLAFLDAPDNNYSDFKQLIELQIGKVASIKGRAFTKFFATLNLLSTIIFHYSAENNNLIAAKECSAYIVLRTWSWVLKNGFERKEAVLREFRKLLKIQHQVLYVYFNKTLPIALLENGLFSENGLFFETIGYPLRCFEYISDLIYHFQLIQYLPEFSNKSSEFHVIRNQQKDTIIDLVNINSGFFRPLIDNHSISILQLFLFFADKSDLRKKDTNFIASYIFGVINGLLVIKTIKGRLPELYNKIELVAEYSINNTKPEEYTDESSMLIALLLELIVLFDAPEYYELLKTHLDKKLNLQIAQPNFNEYDIEQIMFEKSMQREYWIESHFKLPDDFEEFKEIVKKKEYCIPAYRTDKAGFPFLRTLAHHYFKNEIFPNEWREIIAKE